ncbi:L,D-transpeptidase [Candidatus Peregrinibacteria bacterium]|jgi:hypothetical protein|nr:L,D-transpeptidase [Candidatus Peregrinibacteria bacterium]
MTSITSTLLGLIMAMPMAPIALPVQGSEAAPVAYSVSSTDWEIEPGDKVLVDTDSNTGYMFHEDGRYLEFEVVTGQRRFVSYIGRYYNAATPTWNWVAKTMHIKGDRLTFGPSGRFLRLYKDGEEHTAYGFHEYGQEEEIFTGMNTRFRSMGCIIVRTVIMDLIVSTWEQNDGYLPTKTIHGIDNLTDAMVAFGGSQEVAQNL